MITPDTNSQQHHRQHQDDDTIDLKKILFLLLRNWYWFVIAVGLALTAAFLYNRYTVPVYEVNSTLLLEEEQSRSPFSGGGAGGAESSLFQGFGMMGSMQNIYNQIVILQSSPIIAKTLHEVQFEVSYYSVGRVKTTEQYKDVPFHVIWDQKHPQLIDANFDLEIDASGNMRLNVEAENAEVYRYNEDETIKRIPEYSYSNEFEPGAEVTTEEFSFQVFLNENFTPGGQNQYRFVFHSTPSLVKKYKNNLAVTLPDDETSILNLTLNELNVKKGEVFLNKLTEVYQLDNLDKKNENANRTIQFISSQLENISDSLNLSENRMESFQSENQVLDISMQSQQLLEKMSDLDKEKVALETQNKYYHYLNNYIKSNQELETVIAPSAMGIQDPLLNSLILQLNDLITQKSSQTSIRSNSQHPTILRLNAQIESVKNSLMENTSNIIQQSDIALENLNERIRQFETQIRRLPATERSYVNIEREYKLNNETYTFLLQKLSEAQIAKASNIPDSQVIEEAKMKGTGPIEPKTTMAYAIALLLGLALPAGFLFLGDFFNNKIKTQEDIEGLTHFPVIGHVFQNEKEFKSRTLVLNKPNSPASEPYRAIRSKINLMVKGKDKPIIGVTSTFPKEGKSYTAVNIASSFALLRKKTVLLDLDLRNSKLKEEFGFKSDEGVVNYIIGKSSLEEITFSTKHPWLKIIPAGPIPPNPAEMLTDPQMMELMEKLKENYDVIIVDSPPVGYVA
ncbi:MAG TPA: polysaccharide biosynthesis tyrosine autokinase, partial [Prolixibacteraceae bacterium]|nr:polysaccharide biosynthesis tyrosine autokinase [Prolixibacteraceae bacterium]